MTCLDSKINFLPNGGVCGCAKQVIIRFGKSQTIRNVFTTLNRHYYGMAGWIELNYYNSFCCQRCQTCWCAGVRVYLWVRVNNVSLCLYLCSYLYLWLASTWQTRFGAIKLRLWLYFVTNTMPSHTRTHLYCHKQMAHTHSHTQTQSRGPCHIVLKWKWLTIAAGTTTMRHWCMFVMDFPIKRSLRPTKQKP